MATGNFYNENATSIFAVLMGYETPVLDDDGNETDENEYVQPEEWEYTEMVDCLYDSIKQMAKDNNIDFYNKTGWNNDRNFGGTYLGSLSLSDYIAETDVAVIVTPIMRSGYYEGANLDFDVEVEFNGSTYNMIDESDIAEELVYNNMDEKVARMEAANIIEYVEDSKATIIKNLENLYRSYCGHELKTVARFSNGETIYAGV